MTSQTAAANRVKVYYSLQPEIVPVSAKWVERFDEADRDLLRRIFSEPAEYLVHPLFKKRATEKTLFGGRAKLPPGDATYFIESEPRQVRRPRGTALPASDERRLFLRFNYARYRVYGMVKRLRHRTPDFDTLRKLLGWTHRILMVRSEIVQANVPLVLAMAKRTRLSGVDFAELVSEGNMALLRTVDKFDCNRGFKFSTYACRAILKSFSRVAMRASRYHARFPAEFDPGLQKGDYAEQKRDDLESDCVDELRDILGRNLAGLSDVERTVITERFALSGGVGELPSPKTLAQVGSLIGVTKERVRQIQNKALQKIRSVLDDGFLAA